MTNEEAIEMAEAIYSLDASIIELKNKIEVMEQERDQLSGALADDLGKGGAVMIHGGKTVAFVGDGRRGVDKRAVDELAEGLPPDLRPQEVTTIKYPTVAALEKAEPVIKAMGMDPTRLIKWSGRRWVMRFRDPTAL